MLELTNTFYRLFQQDLVTALIHSQKFGCDLNQAEKYYAYSIRAL